MTDTISLLYTTINSHDAAEALAEKAIQEKVAACVNIIPHATSLYMWEGKLEKNEECLMLFKTSTQKIQDLKAWMLEHHPYDTPAVCIAEAASSADFTTFVASGVLI